MVESAQEQASSSEPAGAGQFQALKQVFPQVEDSILLETLKDEGSIDGAVNSLLKSLDLEMDSQRLQIQSDEQIAMALQGRFHNGEPGWSLNQSSLFQAHDWLANQEDVWEGIKQYATDVVDYVSCGVTQIAENLNQYITESNREEDLDPPSRSESQDPAVPMVQRETKKER